MPDMPNFRHYEGPVSQTTNFFVQQENIHEKQKTPNEKSDPKHSVKINNYLHVNFVRETTAALTFRRNAEMAQNWGHVQGTNTLI